MKNEDTTDKISKRLKLIVADLKRYAEKRVELMVISIGEQYARWIAESIQRIAGVVFLFGGLMFVFVALAFYLGALLNSYSLGFVLASLPLFFIGYMLFNLKPRSISEKMQSEFEEELVGIFKADKENQEKVISPPEQNQLESKKEHHV